MRRSEEHEYAPVDFDDDDIRFEKSRNWFPKDNGREKGGRCALWKVMLLIELLNLVALATGYGAWRMAKRWKNVYHSS
jgi:hypothetical protein